MLKLTLIQTIAVWAIPVLLAITLHEAAHAWVAYRCGDSTAKMLGRLSINPFRHIDLLGTIIVPIAVGVLSHFQFVFGWAKPVPIHWARLHHPRRDMAFVAIAGPLVNLFMALLWALCLKVGFLIDSGASSLTLFMILSGQAGMIINLVLAFLNLLPIPPLDGSRVVSGLIPPALAAHYQKLEPFGFIILALLLFSGLLQNILSPLLSWALGAMLRLLHLSN